MVILKILRFIQNPRKTLQKHEKIRRFHSKERHKTTVNLELLSLKRHLGEDRRLVSLIQCSISRHCQPYICMGSPTVCRHSKGYKIQSREF